MLHLRALFSCLHWQKCIFFFFYCNVPTKKLMDIKVRKKHILFSLKCTFWGFGCECKSKSILRNVLLYLFCEQPLWWLHIWPRMINVGGRHYWQIHQSYLVGLLWMQVRVHIFSDTYRIVASTNKCYYSENQVFGGVTIRVLCSKRGCY